MSDFDKGIFTVDEYDSYMEHKYLRRIAQSPAMLCSTDVTSCTDTTALAADRHLAPGRAALSGPSESPPHFD